MSSKKNSDKETFSLPKTVSLLEHKKLYKNWWTCVVKNSIMPFNSGLYAGRFCMVTPSSVICPKFSEVYSVPISVTAPSPPLRAADYTIP